MHAGMGLDVAPQWQTLLSASLTAASGVSSAGFSLTICVIFVVLYPCKDFDSRFSAVCTTVEAGGIRAVQEEAARCVAPVRPLLSLILACRRSFGLW